MPFADQFTKCPELAPMLVVCRNITCFLSFWIMHGTYNDLQMFIFCSTATSWYQLHLMDCMAFEESLWNGTFMSWWAIFSVGVIVLKKTIHSHWRAPEWGQLSFTNCWCTEFCHGLLINMTFEANNVQQQVQCCCHQHQYHSTLQTKAEQQCRHYILQTFWYHAWLVSLACTTQMPLHILCTRSLICQCRLSCHQPKLLSFQPL